MGKISEELQMIDSLLMEFHDRIQSGRCLTNKQQNTMMLNFLHQIANKDEPISKAEACGYVKVSRATFDRLVKEGYLERRSVEGDRRKTELICTQKAQPVIGKGQKLQADFKAQMFFGMDADVQRQLEEITEKIEQNLDEILKEEAQ